MKKDRKVVLYIASSLDGYIARNDGSIDWLGGEGNDLDSDYGYSEFYENIDTVIMGRKTYEQVVNELSPKVWPYEGKESYVITRKIFKSNNDIKFVNSNVNELIIELKKKGGKDIWIVGGSLLIDSLIRDGLIDEYIIFTMPIILGDGIPLFLKSSNEIKLSLKDSNNFDGVVMTHYIKK